MSAFRIQELETPFVFRDRPESLPGDLRPLWRIGLVLLILRLASRAGKASFGKLHVLNWALRTADGLTTLHRLLDGQIKPETVVVRVEPSLNRALDLAYGAGLVRRVHGDRVELTQEGIAEADRIVDCEALYTREREMLLAIGKSLTEGKVANMFQRQTSP